MESIISCYTCGHVHRPIHQSHEEDYRCHGGGAHHYGARVLIEIFDRRFLPAAGIYQFVNNQISMSTKNIKKDSSENKIVLYTDKNGNVELRADVKKETIWATLDQIARLFGRDKSVISRHLRNIFMTQELSRKATVAKNATVQTEGGREIVRNIEYYNLDVILSVGYRVNSKQATQFRIWATGILRNYLVKGFNIDRRKLAVSDEKFNDLQETISFLESKNRDKPLKAKVIVRLSKDLMP